MTEEKSSYFKELALNLRQEGFTAGQPEDGLLPVEVEGRRLCRVMENGGVRYQQQDVAGNSMDTALERVIVIARATAEYMGEMEAVPCLAASGLTGDSRLLAEFNDTVLAGHPTKYGMQFVTWDRVQNRTALHQGNYYGPNTGIDGYTAAKRDFTIRSGLVPRSALFAPEQLVEIYRSVHETLNSGYPITVEQEKLLEGVAEQIEQAVPALQRWGGPSNQKELEAGMYGQTM